MKLIMLKGLPGSGKTTWAKQYLDQNPNAVRINKDDLRAMLHNSRWSKSNEKQVIEFRDSMVIQALDAKKDVIVDDTNFHPIHEERLREIGKTFGVAFEVKEFDVPLEECIKRDLARPNSVGEKVIKRMHSQFVEKRDYRGNPLNPVMFGDNLPDCVIFDLDGTLACMGDRSPYDGKSCLKDYPNHSIIALNKWVPKDVEIILFSGRGDDAKKETLEWLDRHDVSFNALHMRRAGDNRKDAIIKEEMFNAYIKDKYNVIFIVDDRDQVVKMWRDLGLTCLQVNYGEF